jgi:hypothetical protein
VKAFLSTPGPVRTAFLGSLLLSFIALQNGTLNRDGMLYVETARIFIEQGFHAAMANFNWPFLSLLMAGLSLPTGLDLETSGHLLNALFMAGACALLVACARRGFPEATWHVCLVVLALPGLNGYRDELLREYGGWFFIMLAIWLALRWSDAPRWPLAIASQLALGMAALFRAEALALFLALICWQVFAAPAGERSRRLAMIGGLPIFGFATLLALLVVREINLGRLPGDFGRFFLTNFSKHAKAIAGVLPEYGQPQASLILFFGSLAIVPVKFVGKLGVFVVPLLLAFGNRMARDVLVRAGPFAWAFLLHFLVLCVFVLEAQFLAGRYVGLLLLFSAPVTGYGLWRMCQRFPRWKPFVLALVVLIMASNVISLSPTKQYFVEAGQWLADNAGDTPRVYVESVRTAYYAGWRIKPRLVPQDRQKLEAGLREGKYDIVVLEVSRKEPDISPWLAAMGLVRVIDFVHANGDAVIIAKPAVVPKTP